MKLRKCIVLAYLSKRFNKPSVTFLRVWTTKTIFLRKILKVSKILKNPAENCENAVFLHIFQHNFTNHALISSAFGRKTQIVGKLLENFEKF